MQILLGAHETVVKINSKNVKIDYIQHFISTHFSQRVIKDNYIHIPESKENDYHRIFLLKWIYSLYAKKNNHHPELKELLINRQYKSIKIFLPQKIVHRIKYSVFDKQTLHVQIQPANYQIAYQLKTYLGIKFSILPTYLSVKIKSKQDKELLKEFINAKDIIDVPHVHVYNKIDMQEFLSVEAKKQKVLTKVDMAYLTLELSAGYDEKLLKKQYKKLAKEFHPDKVTSKDSHTISLYTSKFQSILNAYEVLKQNISH